MPLLIWGDYINRDFFASSRPSFLSSEGLTPAQKGTATHKFMQYADYSLAKKDSAAECARLVNEGFLSELEARPSHSKRLIISSTVALQSGFLHPIA